MFVCCILMTLNELIIIPLNISLKTYIINLIRIYLLHSFNRLYKVSYEDHF